MSHVSTTDLITQLTEEDKHYAEVLSDEAISVELAQYPNPAPRHPHKEDELYYIIAGSGMVDVGDETYAVEEGDVVYVEQGLEHDFYEVEDTITALVVFAGGQDSVFGRDG
ncbi:MAG: mannose-6-phosphate isomerase-like protein (cupin superfamily) [Haloarculaceae archaeon]|jgi:mannose-6-phosphate isomerase-like protein (cupin superfamily)